MDFLLDSNIWYVVSFAMFAAVIWKFGKPAIVSYIDGRIEAIREEINTAENLRTEAHELLAQYQRKHRDAVQEADSIIKTAQQHADEIRIKADADIKETIERREKQLQERLKRMELSAIDDIKAYTANLAIEATAEIIADKLDKKTGEALVEQSIKELGQKPH